MSRHGRSEQDPGPSDGNPFWMVPVLPEQGHKASSASVASAGRASASASVASAGRASASASVASAGRASASASVASAGCASASASSSLRVAATCQHVSSARGRCSAAAAPGRAYCAAHLCPACGADKPSTAAHCDVHAAREGSGGSREASGGSRAPVSPGSPGSFSARSPPTDGSLAASWRAQHEPAPQCGHVSVSGKCANPALDGKRYCARHCCPVCDADKPSGAPGCERHESGLSAHSLDGSPSGSGSSLLSPSSVSRCAHVSANGHCREPVPDGQALCPQHRCPVCQADKPSAAHGCPAHPSGQTAAHARETPPGSPGRRPSPGPAGAAGRRPSPRAPSSAESSAGTVESLASARSRQSSSGHLQAKSPRAPSPAASATADPSPATAESSATDAGASRRRARSDESGPRCQHVWAHMRCRRAAAEGKPFCAQHRCPVCGADKPSAADGCAAHPSGRAAGFRYVFTDVDNTLTRYGTRDVFPGAVQFVHELRGDMDAAGAWEAAPKVTILSARPNLNPLNGGGSVSQLLQVDGQSIYEETLSGNPLKPAWKMIKPTYIGACEHDAAACRAMAADKVQNLRHWRQRTEAQRNLKHQLVFLGDNGEGDVIAAQEMLSSGFIDLAFMRRVTDLDKGFFIEKTPCTGQHPGLYYFDDYADAAKIARDHGVLSKAACLRVEEAARRPHGEAHGGFLADHFLKCKAQLQCKARDQPPGV